jgi:hypothetical protein
MSAKENPARRTNAGTRAKSKIESTPKRASAVELEAEAAAALSAHLRVHKPALVEGALASPASFGKAFK